MSDTSGQDVTDWWQTDIIDMAPGHIRFRGHPVQDLIGTVSFPKMIWLLTRGDLPSEFEIGELRRRRWSIGRHRPVGRRGQQPVGRLDEKPTVDGTHGQQGRRRRHRFDHSEILLGLEQVHCA